eukprot:jgi/Chlat1/3235/Chrsp22S03510
MAFRVAARRLVVVGLEGYDAHAARSGVFGGRRLLADDGAAKHAGHRGDSCSAASTSSPTQECHTTRRVHSSLRTFSLSQHERSWHSQHAECISVRTCSTTTTSATEKPSDLAGGGNVEGSPQEGKPVLIYTGPMSGSVKGVKLLSLSSAMLTLVGAPLFVLTNPNLSPTGRIAIAGTMIFFGLSTTALLHWFSSTYVHKMWAIRGSDRVEVEVLNVLASKKREAFSLGDVQYSQTLRPLVSFEADKRQYYVDEEVLDENVLRQLMPWRVPEDL